MGKQETERNPSEYIGTLASMRKEETKARKFRIKTDLPTDCEFNINFKHSSSRVEAG
jgi:hypothetical protein